MTLEAVGALKQEWYYSERFPTKEALQEGFKLFWDASTSSQLAACPRRGYYNIERRLVPKEEAYQLAAGSAIHAAMATYYTTGGNVEIALQELQAVWGYPADYRLPPNHKYHHLNLGHLEVIFKNYADFAKRRDTFKPLVLHKDELDLTRVVGAHWLITEDERVVLGESKIIMAFTVEGEEFFYCGKPDLPIELGGQVYLMDHKSTNSYLSDWYFDQYRFSNQLRGYAAMLEQLLRKLKLTVNGALINGIYMGNKAAQSEFGGTRFARYGPMMFQPAHLAEAIKNQWAWRKTLDYHRTMGYYPQHTSKLCSGCSYAILCAANPLIREAAMEREYDVSTTTFLDL